MGNKKANSEKKTGTVYLSLFSEKVVLCVVFIVCCVVLCVGLSKGSNGFPRGTSCLNVGGSTANSDSQT